MRTALLSLTVLILACAAALFLMPKPTHSPSTPGVIDTYSLRDAQAFPVMGVTLVSDIGARLQGALTTK